eukprot:987803-Prorocentrum_minimum.AAC.2
MIDLRISGAGGGRTRQTAASIGSSVLGQSGTPAGSGGAEGEQSATHGGPWGDPRPRIRRLIGPLIQLSCERGGPVGATHEGGGGASRCAPCGAGGDSGKQRVCGQHHLRRRNRAPPRRSSRAFDSSNARSYRGRGNTYLSCSQFVVASQLIVTI